jgi:hypothetical protein
LRGCHVDITDRIYEVHYSEGFMWHDIHTKLYQIGKGIQAILRFCLSNFRGCNVVITDEGFMKCSTEMGSDDTIHNSSFMTTGSGIQGHYHNNFRGCDVGITDGWVL